MRAYLELVRLPAVFTAPADVLAGVALGGLAAAGQGGGVPNALPLLAVVLASVCIYAGGMAANDLFDQAVDRAERPGRPIPSGRVGVRAAWTLVLVLQALGVALASLGGGGLAAMACGGTVAATYLYNGLLKDGPLGPLAMGLCRYGNATIGLAALGVGPQAAPVAYALPLGTLLYVAAITAVSRYEVSGTPGPGLHRALVAMLAWAAAPAVGAATGALLPWAAAAAVAAPAALVRPVRAAWGGGGPAVRGAVRAGIFGIALVNAALAVGAGAPLTAALIVALALAGRRFGRWFSAT